MKIGERKNFRHYENPLTHERGPAIDTTPNSYMSWNSRNYKYDTYDRIIAIELPNKAIVSFYYKGLTSEQKISFYKNWRVATKEVMERLQTYCEHGNVFNADGRRRRGRKGRYEITFAQDYTGDTFINSAAELMDSLEEVKPTQPPPPPSQQAIAQSEQKQKPKSFFDSLFSKAEEQVTKSGEDLSFKPVIPQKKLAEIVGIPEATMLEVQELVDQIKQFADPKSKLRRRNAKLKPGFVFYGPVGTGKSSLAEAIAGESNSVFAKIKIAGATSMWIGQSERILKRFFEDLKAEARKQAAQKKVVIMLMDEITALLSDREKLATGVEGNHDSRFVDAFNQEMDDLRNDKTISNIITIGTTNLPLVLDDAISRRFGPLLEIPLPTEEGRTETFAHYIAKYIDQANGKTKPNDSRYQYVFTKNLQDSALKYLSKRNAQTLDEFKQMLGTIIANTWGFAQADIERVVDFAYSKSTLRPDSGSQEDFTTIDDIKSAVATQGQSKHIVQARTRLQEQGKGRNRLLFPDDDFGPKFVDWSQASNVA